MTHLSAVAVDDPSELFSRAWLRDVLARGGRQVVQVLTPVLIALAAGSAAGFTLQGIFWAAVTAFLFTVVKAAAGLTTRPTDPFYLQALERIAAAVAGSFLAYFVAGPVTDLLTLPWHAIGWAVVGAAGLSLAAMFTNPPQPIVTSPVVPVEDTELDGPQD